MVRLHIKGLESSGEAISYFKVGVGRVLLFYARNISRVQYFHEFCCKIRLLKTRRRSYKREVLENRLSVLYSTRSFRGSETALHTLHQIRHSG